MWVVEPPVTLQEKEIVLPLVEIGPGGTVHATLPVGALRARASVMLPTSPPNPFTWIR